MRLAPLSLRFTRPVPAAALVAAQALLVAVLYRRSLSVGFLSDAYYLLGHVSRGFLHALIWDRSYHYTPVTNAFLALLWQLFGLKAAAFQAVSLLQYALNGWLLLRLGERLLGDRAGALLGSLLFLASSAHYEVTCWPINGNLHNLAASLYLAGLLVLLRGVRAARPGRWGALFGLVVLAAVFTYEPTVTLVPVGACLVALLKAGEAGISLRAWLARRTSLAQLARLVGPAAAAGLLGAGVRAGFVLAGMPATNAPAEYWFQAYLLVRAVLALFTLTGPDPLLYRLFSLGLESHLGGEVMRALLWGWVVLLVGLLLAALALDRRPAVRFLLAWLAIHLLAFHAATGLVSRHFLIPGLAACLLLALGLKRAGEAASHLLARLRRRPPSPALAGGIALALATGLAAHSAFYVRRAIAVHLEATAASRRVTAAIADGLAARPPARRLLLLNMDAMLSRQGLAAFAFDNGLHQQVELHFPGRFGRVELAFTEEPEPGGHWANGSVWMGTRGVERRIVDPRWVVVRFERLSREARLLTPN
jgi:hypothetical protein